MSGRTRCRLSMCVHPANGRRGMFPVRSTFLCRNLPSEWLNSTVANRRPFTAAVAIARASLPVFWSRRDSPIFGMFLAAGKHGKRRSCRSQEQIANEWDDSATKKKCIRRNYARRCLVGAAAIRFFGIVDVYYLFHLGGISG